MSRRRVATVLAAVLVIAGVALVLVLTLGGDDKPQGTIATSGGTLPAPPGSTTIPASAGAVDAVWPHAGAASYADPVEAARAFAVDLAGFQDPVLSEFRAGDSQSGEVEVHAIPTGPATTVLLRQVDGAWYVFASITPDIELIVPQSGSSASSPLQAVGRARAFEGTVNVAVRDDSDRAPIGEGIVTGSGSGELGRFTGEIAFGPPRTPYGSVVFSTRSAADGRVLQATVVRVRFSRGAQPGCDVPPISDPAAGEMRVNVFFTCGPSGLPVASPRNVPQAEGVLAAAVRALLAGPNDGERAAGLTSLFSPATANMLRAVNVPPDGKAVVDFEDLRTAIPNASTSSGGTQLLSELDATVFQFATVNSVEYRLQGSCDAFFEWLQAQCEPRTRGG